LVNPWIRSAQSLALTQVKHYYAQRLLLPAFWRKLLRGGVRADALPALMGTLWTALQGGRRQHAHSAPSSFQQRMAAAWDRFPGRIFLLLSENDYTAKEFIDHASQDSAWKQALRHPNLVRHLQAGADHTFSSAALRAQVAELTLRLGLNPPAVGAPCVAPTASAVTGLRKDGSAGGADRPVSHRALGPTA
jgi:hypothetical protein